MRFLGLRRHYAQGVIFDCTEEGWLTTRHKQVATVASPLLCIGPLPAGMATTPARPHPASWLLAGYRAPTSCYLSRSSTLRGSSPPGARGQPKRTWASSVSTTAAPSAAGGAGGGMGAARSISFRPGSTGAPAANRSLSVHVGISSGGGGAGKEALRESVLGQAALAQRRRRLQELYSELRQS